MYFGDHLPAHFHAVYGGDEAVIEIETLAVPKESTAAPATPDAKNRGS